MTLQLEIGKTYRSREGETVKIVAGQPRFDFPFVGEDGADYRPDGGFLYGPTESPFDLIEECEPDVPEQPKPEALTVKEVKLAILANLRWVPVGNDGAMGLEVTACAQAVLRLLRRG